MKQQIFDENWGRCNMIVYVECKVPDIINKCLIVSLNCGINNKYEKCLYSQDRFFSISVSLLFKKLFSQFLIFYHFFETGFCSVDHSDSDLVIDPFVSASQLLGSQVCTTTPR
jgi:hypothetical protein